MNPIAASHRCTFPRLFTNLLPAAVALGIAAGGCAPGGGSGSRRPSEGGATPLYWSRTFGTDGLDQARAVVESQRGGFLLVGESDALGDRSGEIWAVRIDGAGQALWSRHYGENGLLLDEVRAIDARPDGDCFVAGASASGGAVSRVTSDLRVRWRAALSFAGVQGVLATPDGGCLVVGATFDPDAGAIAAAKLDAEGRLEWEATYGAGCAYAARQDGGGGFIIGGCRLVEDDEYGPIVIAVSADGGVRWTEREEEPGSGRMAVRAIHAGENGRLIAVGTWFRGPDAVDESTVFRQVLSSGGELLEHDAFPTPGIVTTVLASWNAIDILPSGEYVLAGTETRVIAGETVPIAGRFSADLDELAVTAIQPPGFTGFRSGDHVTARADGSYVVRGRRTEFTNDVFVSELFPAGPTDRIGISSVVSTGTGPATGDDRALASAFTVTGSYLIGGRTSQGPNGDGAWLSLLDESLQESTETYPRQRTEDHAAAAVESLAGDGFVIAGSTTVADFALADAPHAAVFEIDDEGELRWRTALRRDGVGPTGAVALTRTSDGYAVLSKTGRSIAITLLGPDGQQLQSRLLTESGLDVQGAAVKAAPDGGFFLTGTIILEEDEAGGIVWVSKLRADLSEAWRQEVAIPASPELGPFDLPARAAGLVVVDGGCVVLATLTAGDFFEPIDGLWVFKMNDQGRKVWESVHGSLSPDGYDRAAAIGIDPSGDILVAATTTAGGGQECGRLPCPNQLLIRLDPAGAIHWQRTYSTALEDRAAAVASTSDGGIVLLGETNGVGDMQDLWAIKMSGEGEVSAFCPAGIGEPSALETFRASSRLDGIAFGAGEIELEEAYSDPDSFATSAFTQTEQCIDAAEPPPQEPRTFTLRIEVRGDGTVTSRDGVVRCAERCEYELEEGALVELVATPAAGAAFDAWGGDSDDGTVVMDGDRTVRASFTSGCEGGAVTFEEGAWPESWEVMDTSGTEIAAYQRPEGGDPGSFRNQYTFLPAGGRSLTGHFDARFTWRPAQEGTIERLDFRMAHRLADFLPRGVTISVHPALRQGGRLYVAAGAAVTTETWRVQDLPGLRPADFPAVDGRRLDFSAAGEPIELGYASEVVNGSGAPASVQHGVDNWRVVVRAECP
jgi:hypothetical protein